MTVDHQAQLRVHIRWMIRRDMAEVLEIERSAFEFPWFEEEFIRCLRQRNCIGMVAEANHQIVGFMIYELHKAKLHILNFAVAPEFRRVQEKRDGRRTAMGSASGCCGHSDRSDVPRRSRNLPAQARRPGALSAQLL